MQKNLVAVVVQPVVSPSVVIVEDAIRQELQQEGYSPVILTSDTTLEEARVQDFAGVVRFAINGLGHAERMGVRAPWIGYVFPVIVEMSMEGKPLTPHHIQFLCLRNERGCEWLWVDFPGPDPDQKVVAAMSETIYKVLCERTYPDPKPGEKSRGEKVATALKRAMLNAYNRAGERTLLN